MVLLTLNDDPGRVDYSDVPLRLSQTLAGAGKRRIYALGNYLKQRLLSPVSDWIMQVLRELPTDGTFYQEGPLLRLVARKPKKCYKAPLIDGRYRSCGLSLHSCLVITLQRQSYQRH